MTLPVRTTPEADVQILEIDSWWRSNRDASPNLFLQELAAAFDTVGDAPYLGRLYQQSPIPGTRRVLPRTVNSSPLFLCCYSDGGFDRRTVLLGCVAASVVPSSLSR